jgi:hypothetical protein
LTAIIFCSCKVPISVEEKQSCRTVALVYLF